MTLTRILWSGFAWFTVSQLSRILAIDPFEFYFLIALLAIIYFLRLNNQDKHFFIHLSCSILLLYLLFFLSGIIPEVVSYVWIPLCMILLFYGRRFYAKKKKQGLDYLKLCFALLFCGVYFFLSRNFENRGAEQISHLLAMTTGLCFLVGFIIYLLEWFINYIQSNKIMNTRKRSIVPGILIIQTIFMIGLLIFWVAQKIEADAQREEAMKQEHKALQKEKEAMWQIEEAGKRIKMLEDSISILKSNRK